MSDFEGFGETDEDVTERSAATPQSKRVGPKQRPGPNDGIQYVDDAGQPEDAPEPPRLITAAELLEDDPASDDPAELGFEPGGLYRGQKIVYGRNGMVDHTPRDERHAYLFDAKTAPTGRIRAFYVISKAGVYGLVPWEGSTIIWPNEKAWEQDLYHEKRTGPKAAILDAFIKAQRKKAEK